jgi:exportin-5
MILRLFISLVPEFNQDADQAAKKAAAAAEAAGTAIDANAAPVPHEIATAIREFISSEVLQACITSFHEPYFVDLQKELASLIAAITVHYGSMTMTPRNVLLSLPNVDPQGLDRLSVYMATPTAHPRQQRAVVLDLLKDLKGVSVSEMGKLQKSAGFGRPRSSKKIHRTRMAEAFMSEPAGAGSLRRGHDAPRSGATTAPGDATADAALESVSNLFDA